jgi:hypothetical protein
MNATNIEEKITVSHARRLPSLVLSQSIEIGKESGDAIDWYAFHVQDTPGIRSLKAHPSWNAYLAHPYAEGPPEFVVSVIIPKLMVGTPGELRKEIASAVVRHIGRFAY